MKVRVRINPNGVILVTNASLVEKKAKTDELNVENGNADASNMDVAQDVSTNISFTLNAFERASSLIYFVVVHQNINNFCYRER